MEEPRIYNDSNKSTVNQQQKNTFPFFNPYDDIILITGKKKSGKSFYATQTAKKFNRLIIWDYNWEHKEYNNIVHNLNDLKILWENLPDNKPKKIVYQPFNKTETDFELLCFYILNRVRYCCFYVEELQNVETSHKITKSFQILMDSGRHLKIGLLVTTRAMHHIPTRLPDSADFIIAFRQQRKETWNYLKEHLEPDLVNQLRNSPKYYYLVYDGRDSGETYLIKPIGA